MANNLRPALSEILRATFVTQLLTQAGLVVRHYWVTNVVGLGARIQNIADQISSDMATAFKDCMTSEAQYKGVLVSSIYPPPVGGLFSSVAGAGDGTGGATPTPQQVSGVITLRTAIGGRSGRGRSYIPFPSADDVSTDLTPTAAYVTKLDTLATQLIAPVTVPDGANITTLTPVLFHRMAPGAPDALVGKRANDKWGTQRRRGNYGKTNVPPI